jgi:hypothetical protein
MTCPEGGLRIGINSFPNSRINRETDDEGPSVGKANMRLMQDCAQERRGSRDLQEQKTQAASGIDEEA